MLCTLMSSKTTLHIGACGSREGERLKFSLHNIWNSNISFFKPTVHLYMNFAALSILNPTGTRQHSNPVWTL